MEDKNLFASMVKLESYSEKKLLLIIVALLITPKELRQKFLFDSIK